MICHLEIKTVLDSETCRSMTVNGKADLTPNFGHRPKNTIMNRSAKLLLAGMLALTTLGESVWACDPRCRPAGTTIPRRSPVIVAPQQLPPSPLPPSPSPSPNGLTANDVIINDLPADAKRAIRAAANVGTNSSVRQRSWTPRARSEN